MTKETLAKKLLLLDGHSLAFRAFYALPLLQTKKGLYTNAVYGFTTMLLRLLKEEKPNYVVVTFDHKAPTFRHQLSEQYKAHRKEPPGEFAGQVDMIRRLLQALHVSYVEMEGFEADDILGTLAKKAEGEGMQSVIVTGDLDLLQLVSPLIEVLVTKKGISQLKRFTPQKVREHYGLEASQLADYRGLKGDPSDNIPGVPGIGSKTAVSLLQEYGTLDNLLESKHLIKQKKVRENLCRYEEQAVLSQKLAQICCKVPITFSIEECSYREPDKKALRNLFQEWEFNSLMESLSLHPEEEDEIFAEPSLAVIAGEEDFLRLLSCLKKTAVAAFLFDMEPLHFRKGRLNGLAVALSEEEGFYIQLNEKLQPEYILKSLQFYFQDASKQKYFHDIKLCRNILANYNIALSPPFFDSLLAAYLLQPGWNTYEPAVLAREYLGKNIKEPDKKVSTEEKQRQRQCYLLESCKAMIPLQNYLSSEIKAKDLEELYQKLELPLADVLAAMERHGIGLDGETLQHLADDFSRRMEDLEREIYTLAGGAFNLNSPKQLSYVLFEKMGIRPLKKTKTGFSTDASVLEELAVNHEIAQKILDYRSLMKLKTTYLDGLLAAMERRKGCLFTTFNQAVTATGRLSSSEPNLQNIPVKWEEGRRIRLAFKACNSKNLLLAADYSQIELRILAHLSQDPLLLQAFKKGEDIHARTAAEIFGVPLQEVDSNLRNRAKAVNFGIIYGISDYGLSRDLKISREEARTYIDNYFERYKGVQDFMNRCIEEAREKGYVKTILNRRRYLPELHDRNFQRRSFAERMARNTPIQGSAADVIKLAMLSLYRELQKREDESAIVLQVHDELIIEVPPTSLEEVARLVKKCMEEAINLSVPLKVDIKAGSNWYEMFPVEV